MIYFYFIIVFVIMQRIVEVIIARKNERWMKARSGVEVGTHHYQLFIYLHMLFFICLFIEVNWQESHQLQTLFLFIFLLAQIGRGWCISSLGKFWNTKVIVIPNVTHIKKGPYRWLKHPNYVIVFVELLCLPLIFKAYFVAMIFPLLHLCLLTIRIPIEERALNEKIK